MLQLAVEKLKVVWLPLVAVSVSSVTPEPELRLTVTSAVGWLASDTV